jgi:hypothetical protein
VLGLNLSRLIERHSDELTKGLITKLYSAERTQAFRNIPPPELARDIRDLYSNLTDWLIGKTERDIEARFIGIGRQRKKQGVPLSELTWALLTSKDHMWRSLQHQNTMDGALQLFGTLEFVRELDFFFERAIYYAAVGYESTSALATTAA